jgi:hypothetical protein
VQPHRELLRRRLIHHDGVHPPGREQRDDLLDWFAQVSGRRTPGGPVGVHVGQWCHLGLPEPVVGVLRHRRHPEQQRVVRQFGDVAVVLDHPLDLAERLGDPVREPGDVRRHLTDSSPYCVRRVE